MLSTHILEVPFPCFWSEIESQLATYSGLEGGDSSERLVQVLLSLSKENGQFAIAGRLLKPGADLALQVLWSFQLKPVNPPRPDGLLLTGSLLQSGANTESSSPLKATRRLPRCFWTLVPARTWITSWQDTKGTYQRWF